MFVFMFYRSTHAVGKAMAAALESWVEVVYTHTQTHTDTHTHTHTHSLSITLFLILISILALLSFSQSIFMMDVLLYFDVVKDSLFVIS